MKKISDVFNIPISGQDVSEFYYLDCSDEEEDEAIAHAINNVDALADALESIINASQLYMEDWSVLDDAKAALAAYRGEA